jgi:hypothetical protein
MRRISPGSRAAGGIAALLALGIALPTCNQVLGTNDFGFKPCLVDGDCAAGQACSPANTCLLADGQPCTASKAGADCASGFCSTGDSLCCAEACTGPCASCTGGTICSLLPVGSSGACPENHVCAVDGTCALANGQPCDPTNLIEGGCASGFCSGGDRFCCAMMCSGLCESCAGGAECSPFPEGSSGGCGPNQVCISQACKTYQCLKDADCAAPPDVCAIAKCDASTLDCTSVDLPFGATAADSVQNPGSCKRVVCDGLGHALVVEDDTNPPDVGDPCIKGSCSGGMPVYTPHTGACVQKGVAGVCGTPGGPKQGVCVACNVKPDCPVNESCQLNQCVTSSCSDVVQDGNETDVDCGGSCAPCADGLKCQVDADCQSGFCHPITKTCITASCTDSIQNQGETDVDCGGPICRFEKLCGTGQGCAIPDDCQSRICSSSKCRAPSCLDGIQNQDETDVDCGGTTCPGCTTGKACVVDKDCTAGDGCQTGTQLCVPQCKDFHQDGTETDVDCGGGTCPKCASGKHCTVDTDCASAACTAATHTCQ